MYNVKYILILSLTYCREKANELMILEFAVSGIYFKNLLAIG